MTGVLQDLRYAFRQLVKSPGFSLTAILSLTCGIAATTAVFSVVWAVLMYPYPYANSERMAHLALGALTDSGDYNGFGITPAQWQQLRTSPIIEDTVLTDREFVTIAGGDLPENAAVDYFTSNGFNFFGVPTLLGRGLVPSDAPGGGDPQAVAVLGYEFWLRRFQGDAAAVGKTIQLARKPYTIVGVTSQRFAWGNADLYLPMKASGDSKVTGQAEIRLKPGITREIAAQQLQPLITQFAKESPTHFPPKIGPLHVIGLNEQFVKAIGTALALLFAAVALLLAIGCGNVSILLLARGSARRHEFALRAAVGASRGRMLQQLLTEALLISVTGAALGVLVSYHLLAVIVGLLPENAFPHEASIHINGPVLLFCIVVALLTGVLFGLAPALQLSQPDVREAMSTGSKKVAGSRTGRATHNALIAGQIALTLLLLATAGAAIESFLKLVNKPLGFDPHNVMGVAIPIHYQAHGPIAARAAYVSALAQKAAETPGVREVAVSTNATPPDSGFGLPVLILGQPNEGEQLVHWNLVSANYFSTLRVPLVQGRLWTDAEAGNAAHVAVVNRAFVRKYFPNGDVIDHSVKAPGLVPEAPEVVAVDGANSWMRIIGVTEDKVDAGLTKPIEPEVSIPYTLAMGPYTHLLVRSNGPPLALLHAIGVKVAQVDSEQQIAGGKDVRDLEHWIRNQPEYARGQLIAWLFGGFAGLALLLAAAGLYSVVSYTVAQRTNEFGIRMALGALRGHVLQLVIRSLTWSVGMGVAIGLVLTSALGRVMKSVIAQSGPVSLLPLLIAVAVLSAVAFVASGIPARRAARIEPMEALRRE